MDVVTAVVGALLVLLALRDVFHTLFHPGDHGAFSARICAALWAVGSRAGRRGELLAGPLSVVLAMLLWIALLVAGFALLYLPLLPAGATYGHGVPSRGGVEGAAYLSSVALATLGLGDVVLTQPWARLLVPLQGLLGFGVLTAAIGWTSQIYPALARRRSLALDLSAALRAVAVASAKERSSPWRARPPTIAHRCKGCICSHRPTTRRPRRSRAWPCS